MQQRGTADGARRVMLYGVTWLLDTAYAIWRDVPLARVEHVVGLDYLRWLSLLRLVRRTVGRALRHRVVCNGSTESWRMMVSRDSILLWHFRSFTRKQRQVRAWAADPPPGVRVPRFTRPAALEAWVAGLSGPLEIADSGDSSRSTR